MSGLLMACEEDNDYIYLGGVYTWYANFAWYATFQCKNE